MNVDKVQKINNLALELMKQGLVQDREEAIKQAERILAKKDYSSLNEAMEEVKELNLDKMEKAEELSQEKVKDILEKNTVFIVGKMKEFQGQVERLKSEISGLRDELNNVKGKINDLKVKEPPQKEVVKEEPQQKLEVKKSEGSSAEDHPRSGKFNDNDVSIEKFFYSGSKAKD